MRLGAYFFNAIVNAFCCHSRFLDFGKILLLAHAFRARSKRLGAHFFNVLMPYCGNLEFQISVIVGSWHTPFGTGVSAYAFTF